MNKFFIFVFILSSFYINAQFNLLNASSPEEVGVKTDKQEELDFNEPLVYPYVDDKDILWSKVVYEYIDGYEQFNYPLFYPLLDSEFSADRKSMWRILREYIFEQTVQNETDLEIEGNEEKEVLIIYNPAYRNFNVKFDEDLRSPRQEGSEGFSLVEGIGLEDSNLDGVVDDNDITYLKSSNIVGYNIKGLWYFDKKYGELRYRLIGIQPVGYVEFDLNSAQIDFESGATQNEPTPKALFWLWYRDIRDILHKHYVFSDKNNSKRISFDQLLLSRKFHTYLYRIDNVMDDRELIDTPYINDDPYLRITESQRLKEIIRNFEHDMWSN